MAAAACDVGSSPPPAVAAMTSANDPPRGVPGALPGQILPVIVSVSPETVDVADGQLGGAVFDVTYRVENLDKVENPKMKLELYASDIGTLASIDVPATSEGAERLVLDSRGHNMGPPIRFRANCPAGTTPWYTLGQDPLPYEQRMSDALQIANVGPGMIPYPRTEMADQPGAAVKISIFGKRLTPDCTIEAQVNRSPVELKNVYYYDKRFQGLLLRSDFGGSVVTSRYLELKLSLRGTKTGLLAIRRIRFREPE